MRPCRPAPLEVVAAHYAGDGALLLAQGVGGGAVGGGSTQLLLAARNHTLPLAAQGGGGGIPAGGLRELLAEVDNMVPGENPCSLFLSQAQLFSVS